MNQSTMWALPRLIKPLPKGSTNGHCYKLQTDIITTICKWYLWPTDTFKIDTQVAKPTGINEQIYWRRSAWRHCWPAIRAAALWASRCLWFLSFLEEEELLADRRGRHAALVTLNGHNIMQLRMQCMIGKKIFSSYPLDNWDLWWVFFCRGQSPSRRQSVWLSPLFWPSLRSFREPPAVAKRKWEHNLLNNFIEFHRSFYVEWMNYV